MADAAPHLTILRPELDTFAPPHHVAIIADISGSGVSPVTVRLENGAMRILGSSDRHGRFMLADGEYGAFLRSKLDGALDPQTRQALTAVTDELVTRVDTVMGCTSANEAS